MTAQEALAKWDAGEIVTSIEMGGSGPGYEQAIQCAIFEFIRSGGDEKALYGLGLSGAQAEAAMSVGRHAMKHGWEATLAKVSDDRRILVSRNFPSGRAQGKEG